MLLNGILFQVGWLLCVFYGNQAAVFVAAIAVLTHTLFFLKSREELLLILSVVLVGIAGDIFLGFTGALEYPYGATFPPFWMMTLWLLFAMTIPWALRWLVRKPVCLSLFASPEVP